MHPIRCFSSQCPSLLHPKRYLAGALAGLIAASTIGFALPADARIEGAVATVAGNGTAGYLGDGGPATAAELNSPAEIALFQGNLYVADDANCVVRDVQQMTGTITTVAGNGECGAPSSANSLSATSAEFGSVHAVAVASDGTLYIGDTSNCLVWKIAPNSSTVLIVAGQAGDNAPNCGDSGDGGLAVDAQVGVSYLAVDDFGNLFIADHDNSVVREVAAVSGSQWGISMIAGDIYTVAGGGSDFSEGATATGAALNFSINGFPNPPDLEFGGGVAIDSSDGGENLYIADSGDCAVREVPGATGSQWGRPMQADHIYDVVGDGTCGTERLGAQPLNAAIGAPVGLRFVNYDNSGELLFADPLNNLVEDASPTDGTVTPVAGDGSGGYMGDGGPGTAAELQAPTDVFVDSYNDLYISDTENDAVREVPTIPHLSVTRIAGSDRDLTAVAVSEAGFPNAGQAKADPAVGDEIRRVLSPGGPVYILGGAAAISPSVDSTLQAMGIQTQRIAGADRFGTAVAIADALGDPATVLEATGLDFPDGLTAGAAAAEVHGVVLLTDGSTQAPATAAYLDAHPGEHYAIGGPAADADPTATPVVGPTRYGTATAVAAHFFESYVVAGFASSIAFPDALSGGANIARQGGPLLLVAPSGPLDPDVASELEYSTTVTTGIIYGGTLAVGDDVANEIMQP